MQCLKCNGQGIVRKDGQTITPSEQCSIRQLVTLYDPCDLCKDGEKEAALFKLVREELSHTIMDRNGTPVRREELARVGF